MQSQQMTAYQMDFRTLQALYQWYLALYRLVYGVLEGERRMRQLRAQDAFNLWARTSD